LRLSPRGRRWRREPEVSGSDQRERAERRILLDKSDRALSVAIADGSINAFTQIGESYYDALQIQINRRFGTRLQFGGNYTWSKTLVIRAISGPRRTEQERGNRTVRSRKPELGVHGSGGSRLWKKPLSEQVLDGWHVAGNGTFYYGQPLTIGCTAVAARLAIGPHANGRISVPMPDERNLWLDSGATPASIGSNADRRLWYPFNGKSFSLPPRTSRDRQTLRHAYLWAWRADADLSVYKDFKIWGETRVCKLKAEAFNVLNHFNPGARILLKRLISQAAPIRRSIRYDRPTASTVNGVQFAARKYRHDICPIRALSILAFDSDINEATTTDPEKISKDGLIGCKSRVRKDQLPNLWIKAN